MTNDVHGARDIVVRRIFVSQIVLIAAITASIVFAYVWETRVSGASEQATATVTGETVSNVAGKSWTLGFNLPLFLVGGLGGSISLLRRVETGKLKLTDASARSWMTCLMPLMYGGVMSAVAYLLFMSGILSGNGGEGLFATNLFPLFTTPPNNESGVSVRDLMNLRPATVTELGKLFVWSFLAGFSEGFVVRVLGKLDQTFVDDKPGTKSHDGK